MKFLHFGCWNDRRYGLERNMTLLHEYLERHKEEVLFISVAGDNYYSSVKKPKGEDTGTVSIYREDEIKEGFDLLLAAVGETETYIVLGNHDVEKDAPHCLTLAYQQRRITTELTPNVHLFNEVQHRVFEDNLFIWIDTSLYGQNPDLSILPNTCFRSLFNRFPKDDRTFGDLINYQNERINTIIHEYKDSIRNILIFGHHPILTCKVKNKRKVAFESGLYSLFDGLLTKQSLVNKDFFYLCADSHFYEKALLTFPSGKIVTQFTVGTGGAEPDSNCSETVINHLKEKHEHPELLLTTLEKKNGTFGFLEIDLENNLQHLFIDALPTEHTGGNKIRVAYTH